MVSLKASELSSARKGCEFVEPLNLPTEQMFSLISRLMLHLLMHVNVARLRMNTANNTFRVLDMVVIN